MKVLVINSGSSSIKFELFQMPEERREARGLLQRIGEGESELKYTLGTTQHVVKRPVKDHAEGLRMVLEALQDSANGGLADIREIGAVGHRVVHGGESFAETVLITDEVEKAVEENIQIAPLHNPPNLLGIQVARELLPGVPQVGVFDTAFHQTMSEQAYLYAVPYELYTKHKVRRYGFHGTSHRYVAKRAAAMLGRPIADVNLITAHLGNGASITAIAGGRSIDTSMGLTPLEGLVMGTRSGDLDPAIIAHLHRTTGMSIGEIDTMLNKKSGVLGLSGLGNDMRVIEDAAVAGNERALLALGIYCYRIRKYVGAYAAALGRVDALVFTAGVGENSPIVRGQVTANLAWLGFDVDVEKNESAPRGKETDIATAASRARILVVPTNEELLIAQDTYALATKS